MRGSTTYSRSPYTVTVEGDGKIMVKQGDWLSKYSWAIYGNYTTLEPFARWNPSNDTPVPIVNKDLIKTGEILLWLPKYYEHKGHKQPGTTPDPGNGTTQPPMDLDDPTPMYLPIPFDFTFREWKVPDPPAEFGYVAVQFQISGTGKLSSATSGGAKATIAKDSVKASLKTSLWKKIDLTFAMKFDKGFMDALKLAIKNDSILEFKEVFRKNFEFNLQRSYQWGSNFKLVPQVTVKPFNPSVPFFVGCAGDFTTPMTIDGYQFTGALSVKGGFAFGLSKKGWIWLIEELGQSAVVQFLKRLGAGILEYLTAEGIVMGVGAILGTLALVSLVAWAYDKALTPDMVELSVGWYVEGYAGLIFGRSGRTPRPAPNPQLEQMRRLGEQDAVSDGREVLRQANDPEAGGSPAQVSYRFGYLVTQEYEVKFNCDERTAQWQFEQDLRVKAKQKVLAAQ